MANLTTVLTLSGPIIESDVKLGSDDTSGLNITNTLTKNIKGDVRKRKALISNIGGANGLKILDSAAYSGKTMVYLKNVDLDNAGSTVHIRSAQASGSIYFTLGRNDFAFFPWNASADLWANMAASTTKTFLEVYIFEISQ